MLKILHNSLSASDDLSSADNLCNSLDPDLARQKCRAWSGSKSFDIEMACVKDLKKKKKKKKKSADDNKACKISQYAKS